MARAKIIGKDRLKEAMALLIQKGAAFVADRRESPRRTSNNEPRLAKTEHERAEMDRISSDRFARIEALLLENKRILERLPDAIREKIGFKIQQG